MAPTVRGLGAMYLSPGALLPDGEEAKALEVIIARGAIDGLTRRAELSVDGFPLETTSTLLDALRRIVR